MAIERMLTDLSAEAEAMGMSLSIPDRPDDPGAERLRAELSDFDKRLSFSRLGLSPSTEDPQALEAVMAEVQGILPTVYALSECKSYGYEEWPFLIAALSAVIILTPDANQAVIEKDLDRLLKATAAMRRLAHLLLQEGTVASMTISIIAEDYCALLQRAVETFSDRDEIDAIADEARAWKILSFDVAAAHLAAEEFQWIESSELQPNATLTQRIQHAAWNTANGKRKRKVFVLSEALEVFPKWKDDAQLLKLTEPGHVTFSDIRHYARNLKLRELGLRASFASLWATLKGRRRVVAGKPWPTIEELEELGAQTADPVTGKPYEWREFEGNKRLFGLVHQDQGPPVEAFLLLSEAESERLRKGN